MESGNPHDRALRRRKILALIGTAGTGLLAARAGLSAEGAALPSCIVTPAQTEGPYFVDERLQRSDIRVDSSDGAVSDGTPLLLQLSVFAIDRSACRPLPGAIVDVWHCDAVGRYSDVRDGGFSTAGKNFLRGYQVTDGSGAVRFTTIYPGWYPGRAVHIHFKIRTGPGAPPVREFTSQLYFDDALTDHAHALPPYRDRMRGRLRNDRDGIFRQGGRQLMLAVEPHPEGYIARFEVGLRMA